MLLVYSYYVLDIVHQGHIQMMRNSKEIAGPGGKLIVGILTDKAVMEKKKAPTVPFKDRVELANSIKYVDLVVPQETYSPLPNLMNIRPDVHMESTSHDEGAINKVRQYMEGIGGRVVVIPYFPGYSSTEIKEKVRRV